MKHFGELLCTQLEFWKKLAHKLVQNRVDVDVALTWSLKIPMKKKRLNHKLVTVPTFPKWVDGGWQKVCNREYQQKTCASPNYTKRVQTICTCSPTTFLCSKLLSPSNKKI